MAKELAILFETIGFQISQNRSLGKDKKYNQKPQIDGFHGKSGFSTSKTPLFYLTLFRISQKSNLRVESPKMPFIVFSEPAFAFRSRPHSSLFESQNLSLGEDRRFGWKLCFGVQN